MHRIKNLTGIKTSWNAWKLSQRYNEVFQQKKGLTARNNVTENFARICEFTETKPFNPEHEERW